MNNLIKTIIFDIGRVLVDWDWEDYLRRLFKDEETVLNMGKAFFANPVFVEFDRGVWTTEEILAKFIEGAPQYEEEIRLTFSRMGETIRQREFACSWITSLKARGYQVLFLSNYSTQMRSANPQALSFIEYMDGGVFSCDVKMVKPDRGIYECIIDKYNLSPEECIFIDDNAENIEAANEIGIHGIQYLDYEQATRDMERIIKCEG